MLVQIEPWGYYSDMNEPERQSPFHTLGIRLKLIREDHRESLAEVSGAVEIDTEALERIEEGKERPSEDILMLLISHFGIQETEAVQLWESAGYSRYDADDRLLGGRDRDVQTRPTMVLLAIDARVLYTDDLTISTTPQGVVMHFIQQAGQTKPMPVARVGMSYEQAETVLRNLQRSLLHHRYTPPRRLLPPGSNQA